MIGKKNRNFTKDLKKVRIFSFLAEKKLSQFDKKDENKIKNLTF
jgi:hypothetical protein